jgi:hypothetical protein
MVHFDQPALLGVMVLLWSILKFEKDEKSKWVYFIAPIAAVMGRGYVSVFVLFVWLLQRLYKKRKWLREPALWVTVTTILVTGSFLAHNVYQEAKIRNVSIFETNIIASAKSRLGVSEMNPELERKARLSKAVVLQIEGLIMNLMPGAMGSPQEILVASRRAAKSVGGVLVLLGVAAVFLYFLPRQVYRGWRRIEPWQKSAGILFMGYGFLWGIVMRKLTAFHQYTQMFLLPAAIFLVAIALLDLFERKPSRNFLKSSILIAFTLFVLGLVKIKSLHDQNLEDGRLQIAEAQRVLEALPAEGAKIFVEGGYRQLVPGAPFAAGYFFSRHFLAPAEFAEYVITASLREGEPLLNPGAVKFFLYKNSAN